MAKKMKLQATQRPMSIGTGEYREKHSVERVPQLWARLIQVIETYLFERLATSDFASEIISIQNQVDSIDRWFDGLTPIEILCLGVQLSKILALVGDEFDFNQRQLILTRIRDELVGVFTYGRGVFVPDISSTTFGPAALPIIRRDRDITPVVANFLSLDREFRFGASRTDANFQSRYLSLVSELTGTTIVEVMCINAIYSLIPWLPSRPFCAEREFRLESGTIKQRAECVEEYVQWARRIAGESEVRCRLMLNPAYHSLCFLR